MEQIVPELATTREVVADIRAQEGPTAPTRYADVMVTHYAHSIHGVWKGSLAGNAVRAAELEKYRKYRPSPRGRAVLITPLCFETGGRWGKAALRELRRLARAKSKSGTLSNAVDKDAIYRATLLRWRRERYHAQCSRRQQVAPAVQKLPTVVAHRSTIVLLNKCRCL